MRKLLFALALVSGAAQAQNFGKQGFQSFSLNGVVLRQNQAPGSPPAAEINWWIIGGVAVGAAAIIRHENKKDKQQPAQPQCTPTPFGCV